MNVIRFTNILRTHRCSACFISRWVKLGLFILTPKCWYFVETKTMKFMHSTNDSFVTSCEWNTALIFFKSFIVKSLIVSNSEVYPWIEFTMTSVKQVKQETQRSHLYLKARHEKHMLTTTTNENHWTIGSYN